MKWLFRLYRSYRAMRKGRAVFWVPDLKRACFASSERQCAAKFTGHRIERHGFMAEWAYLLFGLYV